MGDEMTRVEKPWGYELHWAKTDRYVGKLIHVTAGHADVRHQLLVFLVRGPGGRGRSGQQRRGENHGKNLVCHKPTSQ